MTRILLPVDGSKHSLLAARKLIALAKQWQKRPDILPLHVHLPLPPVHGLASVIGKSAVQRYYREESEAALAPALKLLKKSGYTMNPASLVGPIAETIVMHAKKNKCDLICLGTHGMTAAGNLIMGSVVTKVLHLSEIPVIVMR